MSNRTNDAATAEAKPTAKTKWLWARFRAHDDGEHEMTINRLVLGGSFSVFLLVQYPNADILIAMAAYLGLSAMIGVHLVFDRKLRHWRRIAALCLDMSIAYGALYLGGDMAAGVYPLMLWCILGNGFRFGNKYLFIASIAGVISLGAAIVTTPFWQGQPYLSGGMLLGLIVLPAYVSTLIRKLSQAKEAAEEASRAKSYFLASVSHELRTPLNAIIGIGSLLAKENLPPGQRDMLRTIVSAGEAQLSMINQLLSFSKLGAQTVTADAVPFDLVALLDDVRHMMHIQAAGKALKLAVHVSSALPLRLCGSSEHIRNILINLTGNAIKFTETGSILIAASARNTPEGSLILRLEVTDTGIGIAEDAQQRIFDSFTQADQSIKDRFGGTGLGLAICSELVTLMRGTIGVSSTPGTGSSFWLEIPVTVAEAQNECPTARITLLSDNPLLQQRIVAASGISSTQFSMVDNAAGIAALLDGRSQRERGAIVADAGFLERYPEAWQAVDALATPGNAPVLIASDGEAFADAAGLRLRFSTILRDTASAIEIRRSLAIATAHLAAGPAEAVLQIGDTGGQSLEILVVDDNATNQQVFRLILEKAGHIVTPVMDGNSALDLLEAFDFDVVMMDVNMPGTNGIDVTKLYRYSALGDKHLPIIGITADASPETAERCLAAGMDACLTKPVKPEALLRIVHELAAGADMVPQHAPDPLGVVHDMQATAPAPDIGSVIDWSMIDSLLELGDDVFIETLVATYVRETRAMLATLQHAARTRDPVQFRFAAHTLAGSAGNVGAVTLGELSSRLEYMGKTEFDLKCEDYALRVAGELDRVETELRVRFPSVPRYANIA